MVNEAAYYGRSMRIGLLADTHIPEAAEKLPAEIMEAFQGVDLILHAGDIYSLSVLDDLEHIAPVLAARGDDDYGDALTDKRVKEKHNLKLDGRNLWLVHDRQLSFNTIYASWFTNNQSEQEGSSNPDIIVCGHEHRPIVERVYDILYVSPGSPTFQDYHRGLGTVGILDFNSGKIDVRILKL